MAGSKEINIFFKTHNPDESYTFQWAIEKFSKIGYDFTLRSPDFKPLKHLVCYSTIKKAFINYSKYIVLSFYEVSSSYSKLSLEVEVLIQSSEVRLINVSNIVKYSVTENAIASYILRLRTSSYDLDYLRNDFLKLVCKMKFEDYNVSTTDYICPAPLLSSAVLNTLSNDLKKLLDSSVSADVVFKVRGRNFPAHRMILSIRSHVFEKMFQNDMKESATGIVEINDIEPDIFKHILNYLYAGAYPSINFETALSLYKAADKYLLLELRNVCMDLLLSEMKVSNIVTLLATAEMHNDPDMLSHVVKFVKFHLRIPDAFLNLLSSDLSSINAIQFLKDYLPTELDNNS